MFSAQLGAINNRVEAMAKDGRIVPSRTPNCS